MKVLEGIDYEQAHFTYTGERSPIIYEREGPVIIPLRSRDAVKESWLRRGKKEDELEKAWADMDEFMESNDVYLFRIDDPSCRDDDLKEIGELLGTPLSADFNLKVSD